MVRGRLSQLLDSPDQPKMQSLNYAIKTRSSLQDDSTTVGEILWPLFLIHVGHYRINQPSDSKRIGSTIIMALRSSSLTMAVQTCL